VFVVHGRDSQLRELMYDFLRALDLRPLEWESLVRATRQATPLLAEVVVKALRRGMAVMVLLTPDDVVSLHPALFGPREPSAAAVVLGVVVLLWLLVLARRPRREGPRLLLVTAAGVAGAGLVFLQPGGPGYLACFMAVTVLALLFPLQVAVPAAGVVVRAAGGAMLASTAAVSAMLSVCLGAAVLFATAGFAAASRGARERAEHLLAVEESAWVAREQAAALGERARLARELHDVLAHTLAGLTVQPRATRLLAGRTGADARLVGQLDTLQQLASDGMSSAKAVVTALRGDAMPRTGVTARADRRPAGRHWRGGQPADDRRPAPAGTGCGVGGVPHGAGGADERRQAHRG